MVNISKDEINAEASGREWVVRFLSLPSEQQVDFLYRTYLEEAVRLEVEELVFGKEENEK